LRAAVEQFIDKTDKEIEEVAMLTLEGHQRAIMGAMTVDEIFKDRKKFSSKVFDIASTDLFNMGIQVISYTLKVSLSAIPSSHVLLWYPRRTSKTKTST